ncbi:alpha/beta hydrolase [Sphingomonas sp. Sphisp140]|uniref:alpha/beta hydrolase n=1 Tax=unclassified Sphingomonas TaxID=196159 RepID=UPI0039AF4E72
MRSSLALLLLGASLAACSPRAGAPAEPPAPVNGLYSQSFGNTPAKQVRTMIVVLHGDSPAAKPDYHYAFARAASEAVPDSIAVALLRPGYEDPQGHRSPGERGETTGGNYTADRINAVAATIRHLQRRYALARTVLVGHSGGAAIAADLAATHPGLVDGIVLVSCPCALPEWRKHMKKVSPTPLWDAPVTSLDPVQLVGGMAPSLRAAVLVGADDKTTPVRFSRTFAEALSLRGIATDYRIIPGKDHELLGDPEVISALQRLAAALPGKS